MKLFRTYSVSMVLSFLIILFSTDLPAQQLQDERRICGCGVELSTGGDLFASLMSEEDRLLRMENDIWLVEEGEWAASSISEHTYDENGNLILVELSSLDSNLVGMFHTTYARSYEANLLVEQITSSLLGEEVSLLSRDLWFYNDADQPVEVIHQHPLDNSGEQWENFSRTVSSYDGDFVIEGRHDTWEDESWLSRTLVTFVYADELLLEQLIQTWIEEEWVNSQHYLYAYTHAGLPSETLILHWLDGAWENESRVTYGVFDELVVEALTEVWETDAWKISSRQTFAHDGNGNVVELVFQVRTDEETWRNMFRNRSTYEPATGIDDLTPLPADFSLANYPNPFNPETVISFELPATSEVILEIYDISGRKVRTLIDGQRATGYGQRVWDGRNDAGEQVASGLYLYRLSSPEFSAARRMLLVR